MPTIPAQARVGPQVPLALRAAAPVTYSVSPSERRSSGPAVRYMAPHWMNTVARMSWPVAGVAQQVVEQVALAGPVPQVVVRIDDRQRRLDDRFPHLVEPFLAHQDVALGRHQGVGGRRCAHAALVLAGSVDPDVGHPHHVGEEADLRLAEIRELLRRCWRA